MIKFVISAALCALPVAAHASEMSDLIHSVASSESELEDNILVPFQGTWVQGPNTFIFTAGDTRESNWIMGNLIGGGGQVSRYLWLSQTATTGTFYFDTTQGRQGPVVATLSNNNRTMTWRFGAETTVLTRVN